MTKTFLQSKKAVGAAVGTSGSAIAGVAAMTAGMNWWQSLLAAAIPAVPALFQVLAQLYHDIVAMREQYEAEFYQLLGQHGVLDKFFDRENEK